MAPWFAPYGEKFTLVRRTLRPEPDELGNDGYADDEKPVIGFYAPSTSQELIQGQDMVIDHPAIYIYDWPDGWEFGPLDAVKRGDQVLEVDGTPNDWRRHPMTGWQAGIEIRLMGAH